VAHVGAENHGVVGTHGRWRFGQGGWVPTPMARSDSAPGACGEDNCLGGPGRLVASWAGLTLFLLFTSFPINSKARVSKVQITFLLNSKNLQIRQVDG
jgi:hypothetical protein